jgi:hypothetical protein
MAPKKKRIKEAATTIAAPDCGIAKGDMEDLEKHGYGRVKKGEHPDGS